MFKLKNLCFALLSAAVLSNCSTTLHDTKACSGIRGFDTEVAAICTYANSGKQSRMNWDEWFDFLYAQPERPDPKDPDCKVDPKSAECSKLPAKGAALAVSSEDYRKNDAALAELCAKGKCKYENALNNVRKMNEEASK